MKTCLLGEVVDIQGGGTPARDNDEYWHGKIPWASVKDINSTELLDTKESITEAGVKASATKIIPAGSIIVPTRMALGKVAINCIDLAINQDLKALIIRNHNDIIIRYLFYFLVSKSSYLENEGKGATVKGICLDTLKNLEIPLRPLSEQKRIASILDKAYIIRHKRENAVKLADEFIRSVFLEMFGDPVTNSKGWPTVQLDKISSIHRGRFSPRPRNNPIYYNGNYPFIQTGDISNALWVLDEWKQTLNEEGSKISRSFGKGTVVIGIVGATIGATAILDFTSFCPDSVVGINPLPGESTSEFIEYMLRFWRPIFLSKAPETARANINLEVLRPLPTIEAPFRMQEQFSDLYRKTLKITRIHKQQHDNLFNSLIHRAFRGEL